MADRPKPDDFNKTVAWFRDRLPLTDAEFADLRARATERANEMAEKAVTDMQRETAEATARAVRKGMNLDTFKAEHAEQFSKAWGVDGEEAGHRLDAVFRQNVQAAYSGARRDQMTDPAVLKARPFWEFVAKLDDSTTDVCEKLNGTVLPASSPWWNKRQPPLHFRCRSAIKALTKAMAERRGITEKAPRAKPEEGFGAAE